jgi:hypothetical protein
MPRHLFVGGRFHGKFFDVPKDLDSFNVPIIDPVSAASTIEEYPWPDIKSEKYFRYKLGARDRTEKNSFKKDVFLHIGVFPEPEGRRMEIMETVLWLFVLGEIDEVR